MTTICFKKGVVAADTCLMDNGTIAGRISKIWRMDDGSVVGAAGQAQASEAFVQWLRAGADPENKPTVPEFFIARQEFPGGRSLSYESNLVPYEYLAVDGIWAIGSGADVALGAMLAGASASEACKIACRVDQGSREPVELLGVAGVAANAAE